MKTASVERLKGLLKSRYGKGLKVTWMKQVSSLDFVDRGHEIKNNDLYVPIQVQQHFFATAVVEGVNTLSNEDHLLITQLVKMVLEPEFYNWYLGQLAHNAKSTHHPVEQSKNIVSIYNPHVLDEDDQMTEMANVIFLQAENPNLIPRLANDVHEISERWAFLKFKDIQSQVKTVEDLKSLGSLTLLIDDVLELSPKQQTLIHQYLLSADSSKEPLLIIGSGSEIESLESQQIIHQGLAQILKSHRLEADRLPRDSKLLHEALEIMLEN